MTWQIDPDVITAGQTGHISYHEDISDVLTDLANVNRSLYMAPSGATAETLPRMHATSSGGTLSTGVVYVRGIPLHQNTVVSNITFVTDSSTESGGSHGWYVLCDDTLTVRAVSADETGAAYFGSPNTAYPLAMGTPYTCTYSGLYYVGVCVVASTMPGWTAGGAAHPLETFAPVLWGSAGGSMTTPPSLLAQLNSGTVTTSSNNYNHYAYTS